ncbi:alpha/beta fold hydrolase [Anditalea andensis]|uniref:Sigma factor sigB regulation protein rsbQ n=1 Tax=Anditalea andensis TaxID=1048983 RepID=A0A074L4L6_9BACT|nr:alpha/beta hydrolase [Anditalea andensis]KEO74808.1 sigma factor sigB regulation protein rsbQ [Anditalea andensis]
MGKNLIARNNINRIGSGSQTIMFAHGYGCDQHMWRYITPAFEEAYDIILFDHVGSGNSDENEYRFEKYNTLKGYADDIIELCENLELTEVIFVGHSVSSMIGALAAAKRPELFKQLIMIGPSPCYINDDNYYGGFSKEDIDELIDTLESNYLGWSSLITPVIMGNPDKPEFTEELNNSFCRMNPEIAKHFAKVTFLGDNRQDLSKITTPVLIIQCHPDVIAPIKVGQFVYGSVQNGSYKLLEVSGHCPHLTAPDQTIQALKSYIENYN